MVGTVIGGRTHNRGSRNSRSPFRASSSGRAGSLHFAPKKKSRTSLKVALALMVVVVLLLAAGVVKAAVAAEPDLTVRPVIGSSAVLPGPAPRPAWPASGEAAVEVEGLPPLGSAGGGAPQPIASLAKIMTAYVALQDAPLKPGQQGYTVTVSASDVADYRARLASSESIVPVSVGETLTEYQLLEGLLIASGNNFAALIAHHDAGSVPAFVAKMQSTAQRLGMAHTTYTDPSGLEATTVSSAPDQLTLAGKAEADPVFAAIVAMTSVNLPVAGQLVNFNKAVGTNGYLGIKTGSDSTAGGCLVFANRQTVGGRPVTILGVVLGQDKGHVGTSALITAAVNAADALVHSVVAAVGDKTVLPAGAVVARLSNAQGKRSAAATTSPLTVMGYGGMTIPLSVSLNPTGTTVRAGAVVGRVTIPGGGYATVTAGSGVPVPSFGWKLIHDY